MIAKVWQDERFPDDPVKDSNVRGTFAFAMTGPDARTTQIYINTGDQSRLDAMGFAPFGKVVEGMSIIDNLYAGYGETSGGGMRAGHQGKLFEEGNAYLDREFHLLDRLVRAEIIEEQRYAAALEPCVFSAHNTSRHETKYTIAQCGNTLLESSAIRKLA